MISLDLGASARLAVPWIITPKVLQLHRRSNVGFEQS